MGNDILILRPKTIGGSMHTVRCGACILRTRDRQWATKVACLLADHCGEVATIETGGRENFRAAPTGRVDLLDADPHICGRACGAVATCE